MIYVLGGSMFDTTFLAGGRNRLDVDKFTGIGIIKWDYQVIAVAPERGSWSEALSLQIGDVLTYLEF